MDEHAHVQETGESVSLLRLEAAEEINHIPSSSWPEEEKTEISDDR
jgi:hypothetical protein